MKPSLRFRRRVARLGGCFVALGLALAGSLPARATTNITLSGIMGGGKNWDDINQWSNLKAAADTVFQLGFSNVTFELRPGSRMRTPASGATVPAGGAPSSGDNTYSTFPGQLLTVDGSGVFVNPNSAGQAPYFAQTSEIRTKMIQSGSVVGTVVFPHLVLNGGQIDTGSDGEGIIDGLIDVQAKSTFYKDANSTAYDGSNFKIKAQIIGSGDLVINMWRNRGNTAAPGVNIVPFILANPSNTFSGQWFINGGVVLGQATNSLGTNNIFIGDAPSTVPFDLSPTSQSIAGGLQTLYDINNPKGNLVISGKGQLYLSQNDTFQSVIVAGHALSPGVHTAAELSASYPTNFPASWGGVNLLGQSTGWTELLNSIDPSQVTGAEAITNATGSITVLAANTTPLALISGPSNARILTNTTATFTIQFTGPASSIQWFSNNIAISDATNASYTTPPATASFNNTIYKVIAANNLNSLNVSAVLTIGNLFLTSGFLEQDIWEGTQYTRSGVFDALNAGTNDAPTVRNYLGTFDTGIGLGLVNYVERVGGYFTPTVTSNYVFYLAADDDTDLYLSTDTNRTNEVLIAQETFWSPPDSYFVAGGASDLALKRSDTFSPDGGATTPFANGIPLTAGKSYYIEAIHHQGTGGDNIAVTFKAGTDSPDPANLAPSIITGNLISAFAIDGGTLTITNQPKSGNLVEGNSTNLSVSVNSSSATVFYQWKRSGTNIPGASQSTFKTPILTHAADNPAQFSVTVSIPGIPSVTSSNAVITVLQDTQPPALAETPGTVLDPSGNTEIGLVFNESLDAAAATNPANYSVNGGAAITSLRLLTNGAGLDNRYNAVVLSTTNLNAGSRYTLTLGGIKDNFNNSMASTSVQITPTARFNRVNIGRTDFYESPNGVPTTTPVLPSDAVAVGAHGFNFINAGQSFSANYDDFSFVYEWKTNSFDVVAQVQYQDPSSQTAVAGLMAREGIELPGATAFQPANRFQSIAALPTTYYTGAHADSGDRTRQWVRLAPDAQQSDPNNGLNTIKPLPAPYPNVWYRLSRIVTDTSDSFVMYTSTNGVTWATAGGQDFTGQGLPSVMAVGSFYSSRIDQLGSLPGAFSLARDWAARIRNYGDYGASADPFQIRNLSLAAGHISFVFASQAAHTYVVEYKASLGGSTWTTLNTYAGTGNDIAVSDTVAAGPRFYRIRAQ